MKGEPSGVTAFSVKVVQAAGTCQFSTRAVPVSVKA